MGWRRSSLLVKRLDLTLELDRQRVTFSVPLVAYWHLDPAFTDAVFLHIIALLVIKADADLVLKDFLEKMRAAFVG